MKRLYPWLIGVGLLGAGCSPKNDVQPGAPVLTVMTILESGGSTDITGAEPACTAAAQDGAKCDPTKVPLCQSEKSWCRCTSTDPMDPTAGAWGCTFEPTAVVLAAFDRVLDTEPLDYDPDKMPGRTDVATIASMPGKAPDALVDYAANGSETALIFKLVTICPSPCFMFHGPHLIISGSPALPSGSAVTVALDKAKVRAKDHTSLFTSSGSIKDGILTFTTAALAAKIDVPVAPPPPATDGGEADAGASADGEADGGVADAREAGSADGGTDDATADASAGETAPPPPLPAPVMAGMQTVTITFNNFTDPDKIVGQIAVTKDGAPFAGADIAATDAMGGKARTYTVTPKMVAMMPGSWPAGAVITITVAADAADTQGVTLGAPASATFVTEP